MSCLTQERRSDLKLISKLAALTFIGFTLAHLFGQSLALSL